MSEGNETVKNCHQFLASPDVAEDSFFLTKNNSVLMMVGADFFVPLCSLTPKDFISGNEAKTITL